MCVARIANTENGGNMVEWTENGNVSVVSPGSHGGIYAELASAWPLVDALS
jgi:hypothetical protein